MSQPPFLSVQSRLNDDKFAEHARWIGIIIGNWAVLESELEGVYGAVLSLEYKRSKIAFYAVQSFPTKRDIVSAAIGEFHQVTEIAERWRDLQSDLKAAGDIRNRVAHAVWAEHPGRGGGLQIRSTNVRGTFSQPRKRYSIPTLKSNAAQIALAAGRLNEIQVLLRSTQRKPSGKKDASGGKDWR